MMQAIPFTKNQGKAIQEVAKWANSKTGPRIMRLFGYAGTGKTTVAKAIAEEVKGTVLFGAFTGKASLVMRNKGCTNASTLHSLIYKQDEDAPPGPHPKFILNSESSLRYAKLLIVDECTMVGPDLGKDLLSFNRKILVLGDPAQLQPVDGASFFAPPGCTPEIMMTEVHRSAAESPIIQLSMALREGKRLQYGTWGDSCIIPRDKLGQKRVLGADIVLCGMNRTRINLNEKIRKLKGINNPFPVAGDQLICLKNDRELQMSNGSIWTATKAEEPDRNGLVMLTVETEDDPLIDYPIEIVVPEKFFLGREKELHWTELQDVQQMYYGNAITCHKAQGSEWDHVVVFDEGGIFKQDAWRWRYTAITRAAEQFTYIM